MNYRLQELIDINQFQQLQDKLYEICPFPSAIVDDNGDLLAATGWLDVCTCFHLKDEKCSKVCVRSRQEVLAKAMKTGGAVVSGCPQGLSYCATPITVDNEVLGVFLTGQFFTEEPDLAFFHAQAARYGFEEEAYITAVKKVPLWQGEQIDRYMTFVKDLAEIVSLAGLRQLRAQEAKRRSEEALWQFESAFDSASVGCGEGHPATGRFIRVNQKLCEITGYSREELYRLHIPEITHPDDRQRDWEAFQEVVRGEAPNYRIEKRYVRKDGSTVWVNVNMSVVRDAEGQVLCSIATIEDISQRKKAEEALVTHQMLLQAFADNSASPIYAADTDGRFLLVGKKLEELFGAPREEILGKMREDFMPAEYASAHRGNDLRVLQAGHPIVTEEALANEDGLHDYIAVKFPLLDARGDAYGVGGVSTDITERKRAEQALRQSEEHYRRLFETMSQGIVYRNADGKVISANPSAERILGFSNEQMRAGALTPPHWRVLREDGFALPGEELPSMVALRTGTVVGPVIIAAFNPLKKSYIWLFVTVIPLFHPGEDKPNQVYTIFEDITERKQAEARASRLSQLYAALSQCNQAIVRCSCEGELFPQICRDAVLFGGMKMAWIGMAEEGTRLIRPVSSYGDGVEYLDAIKVSADADSPFGRGPTGTAVRENRAVWCQDFQNSPVTGPWHLNAEKFGWASSASLPLLREGRPVGALTLYSGALEAFDDDMCKLLLEMAMDISFAIDNFARETRRQQLEEKNNQVAAIVQYTQDAIIGKKLDGTIISWNRGAQNVYGYTEDEAVGSSINIIIPPDHLEDMPHIFDLITRGKPVIRMETVRRRKDGALIDVSLSISPVRNEAGEIVGASTLARDITARKRAEAEHERLEAQLFQAQKMESVGRLAGGVAHDFNNMLNVIMGHTELAMGLVEGGSQLREDLDEIYKAGLRSAELTRQLLTFARKQVISPEILDLNESIGGMLKMLQRLIGEDIHLVWHPSPDPCMVKLDPSQMDQILANLCINARDAITNVGTITIKTGGQCFDAACCDGHPECVPGDYVTMTVSDTGCGMDKETVASIFEPFFTTKPVGQGTGLGLAMVHGAVRQNNGFINVCSEPGRGTTFSIGFPRHVTDASERRKAVTAAPLPKGNEVILLAEDNESVLKLTKGLLQAQGYTVLAAQMPTEAVQAAEKYPGEIHLLITDVVMPEMNGRDLAAQLVSTRPKLKHLFMSGYTADVIAHHGVLDADVHFLQKPFSISALADKVRKVLDSE